MSSATFRSHFDMLSLHESPTKKAKFWTSYVRALKGTEDIRANDDNSGVRRQRPLSSAPDLFPSIFDDIKTPFSEKAGSRIHNPGYRYLPVSRDTYGSTSINFNSRPPPPSPRVTPRTRH